MRTSWVEAIFVLLFVFSGSVLATSDLFWEVTAHRGDQDLYRENSLSALLVAMDFRATSVEFDVHLTKDLFPVIYHDYKLKPQDFVGLKEPVLIKDLSIDELKELRYSDRLKTRPGDDTIPTLEEFLNAVRDEREMQNLPVGLLHLEIKSEKDHLHESASVQELAKAISDVIEKFYSRGEPRNPIIARAFNWDVLREFKKFQPDIPVVLLVDKGEWHSINFEQAIKEFDPMAFAPHYSDLDEKSVRYLTDRGVGVNPWTVNSAEVADKLVKMGVTGITTNHPYVFSHRYLVPKVKVPNTCAHFYR